MAKQLAPMLQNQHLLCRPKLRLFLLIPLLLFIVSCTKTKAYTREQFVEELTGSQAFSTQEAECLFDNLNGKISLEVIAKKKPENLPEDEKKILVDGIAACAIEPASTTTTQPAKTQDA